MSITTWRAEFYPYPDDYEFRDWNEAIDSAILKWNGCSPENLAKHELKHHGIYITSPNHPYDDMPFCLDYSHCALCYMNNIYKDIPDGDNLECPTCPINVMRGHSCYEAIIDDDEAIIDDDGECDSECDSEWDSAVGMQKKLTPMQNLLKETKEWMSIRFFDKQTATWNLKDDKTE